MYNDYYLLKKIEEEVGAVEYATVQDSFTYKGEVVEVPLEKTNVTGTVYLETRPNIGDKVQFLKGSGEDMGDGLKAVQFEDIIRKL